MPERDEQAEQVVTALRPATPEEMRFSDLCVKHKTIADAAREMWPDIANPAKKGERWCQKPVVKAAIESKLASRAADDPEQVRIWFEQCGLGIRDRIRIVSDLALDPKTGKAARLELLKYADELEGRTKKGQPEDKMPHILEGIVLGMAAGAKKREIEAPDEVPVAEEVDCHANEADEALN